MKIRKIICFIDIDALFTDPKQYKQSKLTVIILFLSFLIIVFFFFILPLLRKASAIIH